MRVDFDDNLIQVAFDDIFQVIPTPVDPVVGDAVLWIVVGANLFGSHVTTDGATRCIDGCFFFLLGDLPQLRAEKFERDFAIPTLTAFLAGGDDEASWEVGEADGRIDLVDVLAAGAAGAHKLPLEFFISDLDGGRRNFWQNRNRGGRGVNATLSFGGRDALNAVNA